MGKTTKKEVAALAALFTPEYQHGYLNLRPLYMYRTGEVPSTSFMHDIDPFDAIAAFRKEYEDDIEDWYNEGVWNHDKQRFGFANTYFVLKNEVIIQFGHNFVYMVHGTKDLPFIEKLGKLFGPFNLASDTEDGGHEEE